MTKTKTKTILHYKIELETSTTVLVNPDDNHILSADDDNAILLGRLRSDETRCALMVPRAAYLAAMSDWLDHKADYSRRWCGEFCGVGDIVWDDVKLRADRNFHLIDDCFSDDDPEFWTPRRVAVPCYEGTAFDIDMEHG